MLLPTLCNSVPMATPEPTDRAGVPTRRPVRPRERPRAAVIAVASRSSSPMPPASAMTTSTLAGENEQYRLASRNTGRPAGSTRTSTSEESRHPSAA
jgi:hypothetical protein